MRISPVLLGWIGVALAALLTFVCTDYRLFQLTLMVAYAIAILGLNIVTGFNAFPWIIAAGLLILLGLLTLALGMARSRR